MQTRYIVDIRAAYGAPLRGVFVLDDATSFGYEEGEVVVGTILTSEAVIQRSGGDCVAVLLRVQRCPNANVVTADLLVLWKAVARRWTTIGAGCDALLEVVDLPQRRFDPNAWYPYHAVERRVYHAPFACPLACTTGYYAGVATQAISGQTLNNLPSLYARHHLLAPLDDHSPAKVYAAAGYITPTRQLPPPEAWAAGTHSFVDPGGRTGRPEADVANIISSL